MMEQLAVIVEHICFIMFSLNRKENYSTLPDFAPLEGITE
jgi:hypothetical protein